MGRFSERITRRIPDACGPCEVSPYQQGQPAFLNQIPLNPLVPVLREHLPVSRLARVHACGLVSHHAGYEIHACPCAFAKGAEASYPPRMDTESPDNDAPSEKFTWASRSTQLRKCLDAIRAEPEAAVPRTRHLFRLSALWGNYFYSANLPVLRRLAGLCDQTSGPILECGSGVSTLLLGVLAEREGRRVYALEDGKSDCARIRATLTLCGLDNVRVRHAPLVDRGDYTWYDLSEVELSRYFDLVFCDGPRSRISQGRRGLLPEMRPYLVPGAVLLLDDTHRRRERASLRKWQEHWSLDIRTHGRFSKFSEIRLRPDAE